MEDSHIKTKIEEMYDTSVKLYYDVADNNMHRRGHPGIMGKASNEENYNSDYYVLMGAIETLKQVAEKIKNL
jgi:hypothetical protein